MQRMVYKPSETSLLKDTAVSQLLDYYASWLEANFETHATGQHYELGLVFMYVCMCETRTNAISCYVNDRNVQNCEMIQHLSLSSIPVDDLAYS